jgi:hypothetical protein
LVGEEVLEAREHPVDDMLRGRVHVDFVGIGEEVPFQPVGAVAGYVHEKAVVELPVLGGVDELLGGKEAEPLEVVGHVGDGPSFGDGDALELTFDRGAGAQGVVELPA